MVTFLPLKLCQYLGKNSQNVKKKRWHYMGNFLYFPCDSQSCLGNSLWMDWEQCIMSDGKGFWDKGSTKLLYDDQELIFLLKLRYLSFVSWHFDIVKCLGWVPLSKLPMIKINHLIYQFNALLFSLLCLGCKDKDILPIIGRENMAFKWSSFYYVAVKIQQLKIKRAIAGGRSITN